MGIRHCFCPYCFEKIDLTQCVYRCANPDGCGKVEDPVLKKNWHDHNTHNRIVNLDHKPAGGWRSKLPFSAAPGKTVRCDVCDHNSTLRLCPRCHKGLPHSYGHEKQYLYAVIGAKSSGKTHYITTLINELYGSVGDALGIVLMPVGQTQKNYRKNLSNQLYREKLKLAPTISARVDKSVGEPLVYQVDPVNNSTGLNKNLTLVFYDAAGEDLQDQQTMARLSRYVYHADGVILLVDGEEFLDSSSIRATDATQSSADILGRIIELYEQARAVRRHQYLPAHLAISVSKIDLFRGPALPPDRQIPKSNALWKDPNYAPEIDLGDYYEIGNLIESMIRRTHPQLSNLAQARFGKEKVGYFGVSALGHAPDGEKVGDIRPVRVADPLIWLMHQHGLLPAKKPEA